MCFHMYDEMFADAIQAYSGGELTVTGSTATAGIFATYPADYLSMWGGVVDQVRSCRSHQSQLKPFFLHWICYSAPGLNIGQDVHTSLYTRNNSHVIQVISTAALLLCVLALGDQRNSSLPDGLQPVLVGAAVLVIGISMGSNSGYALNPARDFGPRLFTYIAGWGVDVFKLVVWLISLFKLWRLHFVAPH